MKKLFLILVILISFFNCKKQKNIENIDLIIGSCELDNTSLCPYYIKIKGDSLTLTSNLYADKYNFKRILSKNEKIQIKKLVGEIDNKYFYNSIVLDSWEAKLYINKSLFYQNTEFHIESNNNPKLIKYILTILPIKIILDGFA